MAEQARLKAVKGTDEPLTLETVRQQIDQSILRNVNMTMRIGAAGGVMLAIGLSLMPNQEPHIRHLRMASGALFAVLAIAAMLINQRWGPRVAATAFAIFTMIVNYGLALALGTGISSSAGAVPAALIVVMGYVHGPKVGVLVTRLSVGCVLALLAAQWYGFIPGIGPTNTPPVASYAVVLIIVFMVIDSTITHFSRLFWNAMATIDKARQDLQDKVEMQEKTQRELVDSKQRLATLLDHAPMAVLIFDKDTGRLHYVNHHALQAHGAKRTKDIGRHHLFTEDPYTQTTFLEYIHATRDHGALELQWRTVKKDGEFIWWSVKLDTITIDDQSYVVAFGHDITKRLEAEQALIDHRAHLEEQVKARTAEVLVQQHRLETVIEALPVSLTIKDRQGRYQLSNKVFEEASGLSKELLLGNTADELFPPAMAEQIREHDHNLLNGTDMVRYENSRMRRDGSRRDHLVTKVPLLDAFGQPEAILTLAVDITDQKTMQRELVDAKTEAERLARVKTEFLANMSHEIRTPLHGVLGLAQVGQKCPPGDPQVQQILERITRSGRHLLGVINDILDFSKIDAGKLTIEKCALDPRQLAEDAVAMVEERASTKSLSLDFQCEGVPPAVIGDPLRIRQILINLLSNGVKFTEKGGVTLTLSASHGKLYFAIKDSGIGMHHEAQERVFSPFEQADGSTSRRFGGTGLGLSISRKLALLMGGDITLNSALGEGSTFTLVLPLEEADATSLPHPDEGLTSPASADIDTPRLSGLRILAADDVDINREILLGLLTQQEAEVHCAENGKQALQIHKEQGAGYFDIVLMDVQMPVMNGLQATELLLMREPELPIVALTAHAMAEERQRCTDAGMVGHLAKPFDADDMIRLILRHSRSTPKAPVAEPPPVPPVQREEASSSAQVTRQADMPPEADPGEAALDMAGALKRCGGKDALLRKLITRFSEEQADFVSRCQQLLSEDPDQARRVAHMLKGTSANLGLEVLSRHAGDLENALIAQDTPLVSRTLMTLNTALQQHITLLKRWLAEQVPA
ncbi:MAG: PAS domain S-box protein [Aquabacterium sp.]|uniref:PAS domain S-box protein n=1 Tax=Aquabacterium sp. TaxID=1872578 RepID=UPI0025C34504|nr:PAS domain S-box protein [Aquabacterium sp.]MBI5927031.1 PAS domain S-box protein [Aquabacterium sp.]